MNTGLITTIIMLLIVVSVFFAVSKSKRQKEEREKEAERQKELRKQLAEEEKILARQEAERTRILHIKNLTEQYQKSPRVIKAGNDFAEFFIKRIRALDRDIRIQKIEYTQTLYGYRDHIDFLINFEKENLKKLDSDEEIIAMLRAIATLALKTIRADYSKDDSGTDYLLEAQEEYISKINNYRIRFTYTAHNGNYIPPQEW